jgi:hypothetical protein
MEEKSRAISIIGKIITIVATVALAAFVIFFGIQMYRSTKFDLFDEVYITDNFKAAYEANNDVRTHSVGTEGLSENGVIKITELVYIMNPVEENACMITGEAYIQFGIRINKLHIEEVQEKCPNLDYNDIEFFLVGKTDNGTKYEYKLEENDLLDSGEKFQYKYYKYEKNDVLMDVASLALEMRLNGITVVENEKGESVLVENEAKVHLADSTEIHKKDRTYIQYKFSRKEKKELGI